MDCLPRPIQRYTKKALSGAALLRQMCFLMTTRLVLFLDNQKLDENKKERRRVKKRNLPTYIYCILLCIASFSKGHHMGRILDCPSLILIS